MQSATRAAIIAAADVAIRTFASGSPDAAFGDVLVEYVKASLVLSEIREERALSDDSPRIVLKSVIIPGGQSSEGEIVKAVSDLWFEIIARVRDDPSLMYKIDWRLWEEIVAGAYKQTGAETVILTPRSGDKGRDVIVRGRDGSRLRFLLLDQVKAYSPDHRVGPDDVLEMLGVLATEGGATKGIITTTSEFTEGAITAAKKFEPRLELKPRAKLLPWLAWAEGRRS